MAKLSEEDTARLWELIEQDEVNHTELVELLRWHVEITTASRLVPKEALIEVARTLTPPDYHNKVEHTRKSLEAWMQKHWKRVRMQLPEKIFRIMEDDETQVVYYYVRNRDQMV